MKTNFKFNRKIVRFYYLNSLGRDVQWLKIIDVPSVPNFYNKN